MNADSISIYQKFRWLKSCCSSSQRESSLFKFVLFILLKDIEKIDDQPQQFQVRCLSNLPWAFVKKRAPPKESLIQITQNNKRLPSFLGSLLIALFVVTLFVTSRRVTLILTIIFKFNHASSFGYFVLCLFINLFTCLSRRASLGQHTSISQDDHQFCCL